MPSSRCSLSCWPGDDEPRHIGRQPIQNVGLTPRHDLRGMDRPNRYPRSTLWTCNGCNKTWETRPDQYLHITDPCRQGK